MYKSIWRKIVYDKAVIQMAKGAYFGVITELNELKNKKLPLNKY